MTRRHRRLVLLSLLLLVSTLSITSAQSRQPSPSSPPPVFRSLPVVPRSLPGGPRSLPGGPLVVPVIREGIGLTDPPGRRPDRPGVKPVRPSVTRIRQVPRHPSESSPVKRSPGVAWRVAGVASWYCLAGVSACHHSYMGGLYAAAGPALRVGSWRNRSVVVSLGGRSVRVRLVDWCACPRRVIDLYADAFRRLAPLSSGVIRVRVSW
jgi:hypothetical protein